MFGSLLDLFKSKPPAPPDWLDIALHEVGVHEFAGSDTHNPRILQYHQSTSLRATDDETPWCASFVNWVLAEGRVVGTNSASARSFLSWGRRTELRRGAIAVFRRGRHEWQGHVAFVDSWDDTHVWAIGGNQGGVGGEFGGGVTITRLPRADLLDVRWPKSIYNSTTVQAVSLMGTTTVLERMLMNDAVLDKLIAVGSSISPVVRAVVLTAQFLFLAWIVRERFLRMKRIGE